jgi:serine/threonine protein kinase
VSRAAAEVGSTANSYQILAKLATGGMAEIFLARGEGVAGVERYCVLKRILRDRASDVHFVRMFLDEARLAAQLQHPNIAQVYDIGKLGDSYFFTMEYVHGETVRALLHRAQGLRKRLPINCVLTIAAGTAAGLHHAHDRLGLDGRPLGIVHRDVSPSNLMVSYEGGVKVVDFGVAKAEDRSQETKSGTVKGKISYLSPEQCRGKRVDRRSDLFSLGICFWEMLTTERLFKRASDFDNMNAIVTEGTPPPSSRRPDVPPEIDALVLRLLSKSPDDRFQTADELVEAIEGVAARTSSVLSASALARFVRELFGQRPEPWLELESQHDSGEAVTVTSEPIPRELAIPAADEVNHQLASVVDLSSPPSITESLDSVPPETAKVDKLASLSFPLAAPPPTQPRIVLATTPSPPPSPLPPHARTAAPPSLVSPPPGPDTHPPSPAELMVPAVTEVLPSGPHPARSGRYAAHSGAQGALRVSASYSTPRRRPGWPLYVVIGVAALIGSIAMIAIMMRSRIAEPTVTPLEPAPVAPAAEITASPIAEAPAGVAAGTAAVAHPEAKRGAASDPRVTVAVPRAAGDHPDPVRPATRPARAQPPGAAPAPARSAQSSSTASPSPRNARSAVVTQASGQRPGKRLPEEDEITRSFDELHYDKVVGLCSAGPVSAEHAPLCFIAACHTGNEAKARKLITAVSSVRRDKLITNCKQFGVDITTERKEPADDCEADPMACQH